MLSFYIMNANTQTFHIPILKMRPMFYQSIFRDSRLSKEVIDRLKTSYSLYHSSYDSRCSNLGLLIYKCHELKLDIDRPLTINNYENGNS